jgi:hypothetical protein
MLLVLADDVVGPAYLRRQSRDFLDGAGQRQPGQVGKKGGVREVGRVREQEQRSGQARVV